MTTLVEFVDQASVRPWLPVDDRVMGGVSSSHLRLHPEGFAVFEGEVSSANGGGFASVRHPSLALGTANTHVYRLVVLGDGKRYKLNLRTETSFDGVNYQAEFCPPVGQWVTVDLPVATFQPRFRGRPVASAPPLAPQRVCQVGLMVADRQWGPFALGVRQIAALSNSPTVP